MEKEEKNESKSIVKKVIESTTLKLAVIGFIILLLMIPKTIIESLIHERKNLQEEAVDEISQKWGSQQQINGLILTIPYYQNCKKDSTGQIIEATKLYAQFLPKELKINGNVVPNIRYRGIYKAILYQADLEISGTFEHLSFEDWNIADNCVLWSEAYVSIGISDLTGLKNQIELKWNGNKNGTFQPGVEKMLPFNTGLTAKVNARPNQKNTFHYNLDLKGSKNLGFYPLGNTTEIEITSPWKDPSFYGDFIPDKREINEDGFTAYWKVLEVNRNIPEKWRNEKLTFHNTEFGVELFNSVDHYQKSDRSIKYALLTIVLTFLVYFMVEVFNKRKIHFIHYLLVGFAVVLFYSLLLSLSEHIGFNWAYLISAIAIILTIVFYTHPTFKSVKLTSLLTAMLSGLFCFTFVLLQLEDYSLLVGNMGLFVILFVIMTVSRKWNWSLGKKEE